MTEEGEERRAALILRQFLGPKWLRNHPLRAVERIVLARAIRTVQPVEGFEHCLDQLRNGMIESGRAELEAAQILLRAGLPFRFLAPSPLRGKTPDFEIAHPNGETVFAEAKCKVSSTGLREKTLLDSLNRARAQLAAERPGLVFMKCPVAWTERADALDVVAAAINQFLASSDGIVSVVAFFVRDAEATDFITLETVNPTHRFDPSRDWRLLTDAARDVGTWRKL